MTVTDEERRELQALFDEMSVAFSASRKERARIAVLERGTASSVLGEAEVRSDDVAGIALGLLTTGRLRPEAKLTPVSECPTLQEFRKRRCSEFPQFAHHIDTIESLQNALARILDRKRS